MMHKEVAINQSKLVELMTRSWEKMPQVEGENSVGPKKKESFSGGNNLKSLEGLNYLCSMEKIMPVGSRELKFISGSKKLVR